MIPALCGQLTPTLVIFHHQPNSDQERFRDFSHGARRKTQATGDHIEPARSFGQNAEVLLLDGNQSEAVNSLQHAGPLKVVRSDPQFSSSTTDTPTRLKQ